MIVYYVTADFKGARHALAKFFARAHAEAHAKTLTCRPTGYTDVRIEEKTEADAVQHPSHGAVNPGLVRKP